MPDTVANASEQGIGVSVKRVEDAALLTGQGRFIDDLNLQNQAHAHFVRSPHAHARIVGIDKDAASDAPGVIAVFCDTDMQADNVGEIRASAPVQSRDGSPVRFPPRRCMTSDVARFAGDAVAVIIAESAIEAIDAADLLEIEYEILPSVTGTSDAAAPDAPMVWPEQGTNVVLDWERGEKASSDLAFDRAAHIAQVNLVNNRIMLAAMEVRGALAEFDSASGRYTIHTPTQGSNPVRAAIADSLGIPPSEVRLITPDVGGGFGIKNDIYPEQIVIPWGREKIGPTDQMVSGSGRFFSDRLSLPRPYHPWRTGTGRRRQFPGDTVPDHFQHGCLCHRNAPVIPSAGGTRMLANVYRIPTIFAETQCVVSNTTPIASFRGAGKPEYCYLVERLVDKAAGGMGIDPAELRRRNLISPEELPWTTPTGMIYDSGEFEKSMNQALSLADQSGFAARKDSARKGGKLLGFGYAVYTEPDGFMDNRVSLQFDPSGTLSMTTTGQTNGQGHVTTFSQIVASQLGLPLDQIRVHQGDTERIGPGSGTGGSRTTTVTGAAIVESAEIIIEKARRIAAQLLETNANDLEFDSGRFVIAGTDRDISLTEVAKASFKSANVPVGDGLGLEGNAHYVARAYSYPSGCHVAEVEIDRDTGHVAVTRYAMVSDFGTIVNPMLLEGQMHGGVINGLGQALYEESVYDPDSGQLVTGSFMDYCIPRAREIPSFDWGLNPTFCKTNPLGVKGCGESGPTAGMPAIVNAVVDALSEFGVTEIDMPVTPEKIWRAIKG